MSVEDYHAHGGVAQLHMSIEPVVLITGPAGCIAPESRFLDPWTGKETATIKELAERKQRPWVLTLNGPVLADAPFLKGFAPLYRVTLENGDSILATAHHRMLTRGGWARTDGLAPGMELQTAICGDERRWRQTTQGSRGGCQRGRHSYGEQLLSFRGDGQESFPSRGDVLESVRGDLLRDDPACTAERIQFCRTIARPSMTGLDGRMCYETSDESLAACATPAVECCDGECTATVDDETFQPLSRLNQAYHHALSSRQQDRDYENRQKDAVCDVLPCVDYRFGWNRIKSISFERVDFYYDLHVPGEENYVAHGIVHHNTGKTRGILEHIHTKCVTYPGCRVLIARATRTSLTESVLPILEEEVLGYNHYAFTVSNANRENRHSYVYDNTSEIVLGGLDKPERLYSTQWDIVYIPEATEATEDAFDKFARAMRARHIPMNKWGEPMLPGDPASDRMIDPVSGQPAWWRQRVMDCNPSGPSHWLYQRRRKKGDIRWIESKHEDNPTVDFGFLRSLADLPPGANRDRLYLGKWVASDGVVYPEFNTATHIVPRPAPGVIRETFAGVDWGWRDPGVILVWGVGSDHELYLLREVYFSRQGMDWWVEQAKAVQREFQCSTFVADPARPEHIDKFRGAGLNVIEADNTLDGGLEAVHRRLRVGENGKPGLFICEDIHRPVQVMQDGRKVWMKYDPVLAAMKWPTSILEEFDMYTEAPLKDGKNAKEKPEDFANHAMDAMRYAVVHLDGLATFDPRGIMEATNQATVIETNSDV